MLIDLAGKTAIVTGAGRGIGREIAATFAREGAIVYGTDVHDGNLLDLEQQLRSEGWQGGARRCDVLDFQAAQELVEEITTTHGHLDILVNNAGVAPGGPIETLSEQAWDLNLDINLKGVFLMCKAVIPQMKRQRSGRILNAASFAAIIPIVGSTAYAASKAGVHFFTRGLAGELGPWDITVNCYAPGMIPSEINHFTEAAKETQDLLLDTLTLRRWGKESEVANLLCFLASDHGSYITGSLIDCSGGKLATQIPARAYGWDI